MELLSTAESPAGDWEAKKTPQDLLDLLDLFHLLLTAPWSQRNQLEQGWWVALSFGGVSQAACTLPELSWRPQEIPASWPGVQVS